MEVVKKLFDTADLYAILNITKDKVSDAKALKSAYMKAALSTHPDKGPAEEREVRTQKFQVVKRIYDLFQDEDLRKAYDATGEWPDKEEYNLEGSFGKLDEQTILDFKKTYLGSQEERDDVKKYYAEGKGDLFHVLENVFFANVLDDEERMQSIIDDLIKTGEMEKLGAGVNAAVREKKIKEAKNEAKEAEALRKELNLDGGLDSLRLAMAKNNAKRGGFLDDLEKKYAGAEKNGKSKDRKGSVKSKHEDDEEDIPAKPKAKKTKSEPVPSGRSTRSRPQ